MSEEEFHVHGPHDHAMAHATEHGGGMKGLTGRLAVATALLATVGATFSYLAGATQADAALAKDDAAIRKTEVSDQWNFYQAKNSRLAIAELSRDLVPPDRVAAVTATMDKLKSDEAPIMARARQLEQEASDFDARSEALMHRHHRWAAATTFLQVSIALAAIALLTQRAWLERGVFAVAAIGILTGLSALWLA